MTTAPTSDAPVGEQPNKLAGGCVLVIACGVAGCAVYAVPELGYTIAGLGANWAYRLIRGWFGKRRESAPETPDEEEWEVDILACLHELSDGQHSVLLTALKEAAELPDTKTVRTLLDDAGIPTRKGVRTPTGNGPGVHHDDIPAPPPGLDTPSGNCVCAGHNTNTNANNNDEPAAEKGLRVSRIGQGGTVITNPSETMTRHHAITK